MVAIKDLTSSKSRSSFLFTAWLNWSRRTSTRDVVVGGSSPSETGLAGDSLFSTTTESIFLGTICSAVLLTMSLTLFFNATSIKTAPRFACESSEEVVFKSVDTILDLSSSGTDLAGLSAPNLASTPACPAFLASSSPVPKTLAGDERIVEDALIPFPSALRPSLKSTCWKFWFASALPPPGTALLITLGMLWAVSRIGANMAVNPRITCLLAKLRSSPNLSASSFPSFGAPKTT